MKLHELLLGEGLIQIPPKLLASAWDFVLAETLKRCYAGLEHVASASELHVAAAETLLDKASTNFDVEDYSSSLLHASSSTKQLPLEITERYLERYKKLRGARETKALLASKITIAVVYNPAKFHGMTAKISGTYYAEDKVVAVQPSVYELTAEGVLEIVRNHKGLAAQNHALGLLLEQYKGTLEHELTHMIQFLVLGDLHAKQLLTHEPGEDVQSNSKESKDIYFTSPIEFDPWIKAEVTKIRALMRRQKKDSVEKRALIKKFISADLTQDQATKLEDNADPERSDFFISLRRQDLKQWKKAAKLLTSKLDEKDLA